MRTINDMIADNVQLGHKYSNDFKRVFGHNLNTYLDKITGFDIVRFDDFVRPKRNESSKEAIQRRFGDEGVKIIEGLLKM